MDKNTLVAVACIALTVAFPALRWGRWISAPFRFLAYCFSDENKEREAPAWTQK